MIPRKVRIQVALFAVIALVGVSYIAVRYVGLLRAVGIGQYTVHMDMASTGGIFPNAEVTYRGVPVGRVGAMRLTSAGIQIDLNLRTATHIPADLKASVADRSVIGEQYVNLQPNTNQGPYLKDGATIPASSTTLPPSSGSLLASVNGLVSSVPIQSLQTVVKELDNSFTGTSQSLQTLIDSSQAFFAAADQNFPDASTLLDTSATALKTQQGVSDSILTFSNNLKLIASQLKGSDSDLRNLIAVAPGAAIEVNTLVDQVGTSLGVTLANLITPAQLVSANVQGVDGLLYQLPKAIDVGTSVITPTGINVGLGVTFFDPLPCTAGYRGTVRRSASDVSPGQPLNTSAGCTASRSSGIDVRGSQNAPTADQSDTWLQSYSTSGTGAQLSSLAGLMGVGG